MRERQEKKMLLDMEETGMRLGLQKQEEGRKQILPYNRRQPHPTIWFLTPQIIRGLICVAFIVGGNSSRKFIQWGSWWWPHGLQLQEQTYRDNNAGFWTPLRDTALLASVDLFLCVFLSPPFSPNLGICRHAARCYSRCLIQLKFFSFQACARTIIMTWNQRSIGCLQMFVSSWEVWSKYALLHCLEGIRRSWD